MPAVPGQMFFGDAPLIDLLLRIALLVDIRFGVRDTQGIKISNHCFGGPARVRLSFLMAFTDVQSITFKQGWKTIRGIRHHGLEPHNLFGHIGGNHGRN